MKNGQRIKRTMYAVAITIAYIVYLIKDYNHHLYLEKNLSKNMVWLGYFRYGPTADFKYSVDFVFVTIVYIILFALIFFRKDRSKNIKQQLDC